VLVKERGTLSAFILSVAVLAVPAVAHAQNAEGSGALALDEIVVTAQKREQSLQDVPISVVVASGELLERGQVKNLDALAQQTPAVKISQSGPGQLFIRGVGSGRNGGFEQSAGQFEDGIYHGRPRYIRGYFVDVERVEVLKGPQSIYFGNNAIAGAFSVITRKPGNEFSGFVSAQYEFDARERSLEAGVTVPVSNALRFRFAGRYNASEGYLRNRLDNNSRVPNGDDFLGRVTMVFEPSPEFEAIAKFQHSEADYEGGSLIQHVNCNASIVASLQTVSGLCARALSSPGYEARLDKNVAYEKGSYDRSNIDELVLTMNYRPDNYTITSVTGYSTFVSPLGFDTDATDQAFFHAMSNEKYEQFSQELRIASPSDANIEWVAGAYYQWDKVINTNDVGLGFLSEPIPTQAGPRSPLFLSLNRLGLAAQFPIISQYFPPMTNTALTSSQNTYSVFGALTWKASERLRLTAGLRWTQSKKAGTQSIGFGTYTGGFVTYTPIADPVALNILGNLTGDIPHIVSDRISDDRFIPSVDIQYDLAPDAMVYAKYSDGFKAGGFDLQYKGRPGLGELTFKPETVDAFEIGLKAGFLSNRGQLNLAIFHSKYKNLQSSVSIFGNAGAPGSITQNVGSSISKGLEADLQIQVSKELRFSAALAYLDSYYQSYPNAGANTPQLIALRPVTSRPGFNPVANPVDLADANAAAAAIGISCLTYTPSLVCTQDLSGKATPFSPKLSGSVAADISLPLQDDWSFLFNSTAFFTSKYQTNGGNDPGKIQDGFLKLDLRLALRQDQTGFELGFLIKNLFDEYTTSFVEDLPGSLGSYQARLDRPRTYSLQFRYQW
jgi:outer membrane receptor protein involved in Fe transport